MKLEITYVPIADIQAYENNPRKNDKAVDIVAKSIKEYGFLVPLVLDDKNVIICGHTRFKAAIKLGMSEVPCVYTEGLTDSQIKAFRIMDNKSSEYSDWDLGKLMEEVEDLKLEGFNTDLTGFNQKELENIDKYLNKTIKDYKYNEKRCPNCGAKI